MFVFQLGPNVDSDPLRRVTLKNRRGFIFSKSTGVRKLKTPNLHSYGPQARILGANCVVVFHGEISGHFTVTGPLISSALKDLQDQLVMMSI